MSQSREQEVAREIRRRLHLRDAIGQDRTHQEVAMRYLATDPVTWINDWVWTYDPRNVRPIPKRLPMKLWPKQEEMVRWVVELWREQEQGLIKKGRDVGATWISAAIAVWVFTFHPEETITFGSRKEALVDRLGDKKTIFSKIRDTIEFLPGWMRPEVDDAFLRIRNRRNGSVITGEAGDQMGRGGRSSLYFVDEHAFIERAEVVDRAVNDNANCIIWLSTSNGMGTKFHQKEMAGHLPIFRINYRDDPRKAPHDEWRAKKIAETDEVSFAQEHEMDDGAAVERVVIPGAWVMAAVGLDLPQSGTRAAGFDVAAGGKNESVYVARIGPVITRIEAWQGVDTTESAQRAAQWGRIDQVEMLAFDVIGVGAGVNGEFRRLRDSIGLGFTPIAINGGDRPSDTRYDDAPDIPAHERFRNARAEHWWSLRRRFQRTYLHVTGARTYPADELISIPNDPVLITQLSGPQWEVSETGKLRIESKDDMRKRGVQSPDRADALVYAFSTDTRAPWWAGVL